MQRENLAERLFTIGHSNHEPEAFVALLLRHGVTALADVRSSPYSRRMPWFGREALMELVRPRGISYVFLGKELGGRPANESLYHADGWADYERMRETAAFRQGIDRLLRGAERFAVALLCGEESPLDCHRGLMITPALKALGVAPRHIRRDRLETTEQMERNLFDELGLNYGQIDMFLSPEERLADAYRKMNAKKAFALTAEEAE